MKRFIIGMLVCLLNLNLFGQSDNLNTGIPDTILLTDNANIVVKAAGPEYAASGWKQFWWGKHWRQEWTTAAPFPVLRLSEYDGGLSPTKLGGGHESKSLRLLSANGHEYVMRTMNRTHDAVVPEEFRGTFINDVVNDQVSTAHPYGAVPISKMAASVLILHTNPTYYFVPDDPQLGEFRNVFANQLVLLEERPSGKGWKHNEQFGNADDIVNSREMLQAVFASTNNSVDQQAFLKVRLLDHIINDWDRHPDQWVWAGKTSGAKQIFIPIARDRDQAFSKTDGAAVFLASLPWAFRPLKNFTPDIKDVRGQNFSARNLDQKLLNEATKEEWRNAIREIQRNLSDVAIESAVSAMPVNIHSISGAYLAKRLQERTKNLSGYGMRYYSILAKRITITGSAEKERFVIGLTNRNEVSITGLRAPTDTFYHRVFKKGETKEITIYALEGDDEYLLKGNQKNDFTIRLVGGPGNNAYMGEERKIRGKRPRIYDSLQLADVPPGNYKVHRGWDSIYNYQFLSVKYDWYIPIITPGYNVDDGFTMDLGFLYKKRQWGKSSFGWKQMFAVSYAAGTRAVGYRYNGVFKIFGKWSLDLNSFYKGPRYTFNFYGFGNETELNGHDKSFFRVKANNFFLSPGVSREWKFNYLRFGLQYETVKILRSQEKYVTTSEAKQEPAIFSNNHFAGPEVKWSLFNAGDERYPTRGFHFTAHASYLDNLDITGQDMLNIGGSAGFYYNFGKRFVFGHRTGAGTIFGDYKFYQANTIGGNENLRGYWRDRFTGKSNFYQNTEMRYKLADLKGYVFRGRFGLFSFIDDGRVWVEDENSSQIHVGYGGGIFYAPYNLYSFNAFYSRSKETSMITVRAGFFF